MTGCSRRSLAASATLDGVNTFQAADLTDAHLGRYLRTEGLEGVLRAVRHVDDVLVEVALDRPPYVATIPAGRPIDVPASP